jgi:EAL domain-containing protein (putative c-di-GMP-specific phosphodiesterase class I)
MVGLGVGLERAAWAAAVRLLRELPASVYLSVNASPALLTSAGAEALLGDDLRADRLVVELTEHAHVDDYPRLLEAMAPLRRRGVRFAVDDTGAGYSSFAHVLQVRPEIIKLDRTLITDLPHDRARRSLVTALVVLGMDIGASITGEGVETPAQLEALRSLGVGAAQGFLLAQPSTQTQLWASWAGQAWQLAGSGSDALA